MVQECLFFFKEDTFTLSPNNPEWNDISKQMNNINTQDDQELNFETENFKPQTRNDST